MGLEVYYPQDILNALQAAEQATVAAVVANGNPDDAYSQGYVNGYRAALATLALAFGLPSRSERVSVGLSLVGRSEEWCLLGRR